MTEEEFLPIEDLAALKDRPCIVKRGDDLACAFWTGRMWAYWDVTIDNGSVHQIDFEPTHYRLTRAESTVGETPNPRPPQTARQWAELIADQFSVEDAAAIDAIEEAYVRGGIVAQGSQKCGQCEGAGYIFGRRCSNCWGSGNQ